MDVPVLPKPKQSVRERQDVQSQHGLTRPAVWQTRLIRGVSSCWWRWKLRSKTVLLTALASVTGTDLLRRFLGSSAPPLASSAR